MTVYITGQGDCYHAQLDCRGIIGGQNATRTMDGEVHPVEEVTLTEAKQRGKKRCSACDAPA